MGWAGHVTRVEVMRNAYKLLVAKPEVKRLFRRPKYRSEYNIRMDLREIVWEVVDWMQGPMTGCCEHGNELTGFIKKGNCLTS
jgi:hypothetical protein